MKMILSMMLMCLVFLNYSVFAAAALEKGMKYFKELPQDVKVLYVEVLKTLVQDESRTDEEAAEAIAALIMAKDGIDKKYGSLDDKILGFVKAVRTLEASRQTDFFDRLSKMGNETAGDDEVKKLIRGSFPDMVKRIEELGVSLDSFTALLDIANIFSGDEKIISYHFKVNRDIVKHLIGQDENSDGFFGVAESECNNIINVFEARADKLSSSQKKEMRSKLTAAGYMAPLMDDITSHWAKAYIEALADQGIIKGVGNRKYNPDGTVTRAEFIVMLTNALVLKDETAESNFADVPEDAWYYRAVASAEKLGMIEGIYDSTFEADQDISRQDMTAIAYKALKVSETKIDMVKEAEIFEDRAAFADYAAEAISVLQRAGIISGIDNHKFAPNENATRAQAAKIIYLLLE